MAEARLELSDARADHHGIDVLQGDDGRAAPTGSTTTV
jgi:hypothetical protein